MLSHLHQLCSQYRVRDVVLVVGFLLLAAIVGVWVNLPQQTLSALIAEWRWIAGTFVGYAAAILAIVLLLRTPLGEIILCLAGLIFSVVFLAVILWLGWMILPRLVLEAPLWAAALLVAGKIGVILAFTWNVVMSVICLRAGIRERSSARGQ